MDQKKHISVLLDQSINLLNIKENGIYIDCTLGRAGHSQEILKKLKLGKLYCLEQDNDAIIESEIILSNISNNYKIIKTNFVNLKNVLREEKIKGVDGIIYDLGVCSTQLDEQHRGFSYHYDAPLDMRMDQEQNLTAKLIVNNYSNIELLEILKKYGEEKWANLIVKEIIKTRTIKTIDSTLQLVEIIKKALPSRALKKIQHPARKTFQALRIAVNDELNNLDKSLKQALTLLNPDGRVVVISFHSLEDKIVKKIFKEAILDPQDEAKKHLFINDNWKPEYEILTKKIIIPASDEITNNPRSRSAKLRAIKKIGVGAKYE